MNLSDIQVILVNDASTDSSGKIAEEYCRKYDNFQVFHLKDNSGSAAKPRNIALKHVNAEYIMFLDPDDEFVGDYCEVMYNIIKKYDVDLVKCNFVMINGENITYNYYFNQNIDKKIITSSDEPLKFVSVCNGIHKSSFIFEHDITFPQGFGEDIYFSVKEFLCMEELVFLNNYFGYKYFDRPKSHAKSPSIENILNIIKIFYLVNDLCEKFQREDVIKIVCGHQFIGLYYRIRNVQGYNNKYTILKEVHSLLNNIPDFRISNTLYNIANILLKRKLINLTILYFLIVNKISNSGILQFLNK